MNDKPLPLGMRCADACAPGTQMRALIEAIFHKSPRKMPAFADNAVITSDGFVISGFKDRGGEYHEGALVCKIGELVDNARRLADFMKLSDAERKELFGEIQKWIYADYRAIGKAPLD